MHLPQRDTAIDALKLSINDLTKRHRRELTHLLGKPPRFSNVPASFWQEAREEMERELAASLALLFLAAVDHHGGDVDAVDAASKVHAAERAALQGQRYGDAIESRLENLLAGYPGDPAAPAGGDGLKGRIGSSPNAPDRTTTREIDLDQVLADMAATFEAQAERIAASETTNAETAGGDAAQVTKFGDVSQDDIWRAHPSRTKSGSCGRCLRLDGVKRKQWGEVDADAAGGPILHEHCACTIEYVQQGQQSQLRESKEGDWRTINGTPVLIDEDGVILSGPKALDGKDLDDKPAAKPKAKPKAKPRLSSEERGAVEDYSTDKFQQVNSELRKGKTSRDTDRITSRVDAAIEKLPKRPGATARSFEISGPEGDRIREMLKPGATFTDKAYMSTATKALPADLAAMKAKTPMKNHVTLRIDGTSGVDISKLSLNPGEAEIMYPRGTKFRVVKAVHANGGVIAELEEIGD